MFRSDVDGFVAEAVSLQYKNKFYDLVERHMNSKEGL